MALSSQNSDWISRAMQDAEDTLAKRAYWEAQLGMWNLDDMFNVLNDADIAVIFPHLDKSKMTNYVNVVKALLIALGSNDGNGNPVHEDGNGSAAGNLIIMKG